MTQLIRIKGTTNSLHHAMEGLGPNDEVLYRATSNAISLHDTIHSTDAQDDNPTTAQ